MRRNHRPQPHRRVATAALAGLALLLACAALLLAWAWLAPGQASSTTVSSMPGRSREDIQVELDRQVAQSMMTVSVSPTVVLEDDQTLSLHVVNAPDNSVDQTFLIEQGDRVLFRSDPISPGSQVDSCSAPGIEPGKARIMVQGADPETGAAKGSPAGVEVTVAERDKTPSSPSETEQRSNA